ncbi:MAG: DeoR/GlpR transcriptional regulator [Akkermansia sp.]|nr:DeoR/GlpR transcriptional regulator [Akkermansia sp.]
MYVAQERRAYILRLLQQRGSIRSAALARELGVTDETIRTDLVDMQKQGLLKRVHGGARYILPLPGQSPPESAGVRLDYQLVQLALRHIQPGMCLYVDAAPLAQVLISALGECPCSLITNSPRLLARLTAGVLPQEIICPGGRIDKVSGLLDSPEARAAMGTTLQPDIALLCPPALRPEQAMYAQAVRAAWATLAAQAARQTIVLTPAHHLGGSAPHATPLEDYLLITENNLPPEFSGRQVEMVPYISAEDVLPGDAFDY